MFFDTTRDRLLAFGQGSTVWQLPNSESFDFPTSEAPFATLDSLDWSVGYDNTSSELLDPDTKVVCDASRQQVVGRGVAVAPLRMIMVTADCAVFALSLGEQPTWHRFRSREDNVPRGEAHDAIQTPDGLFVVTRAGNYRFDLSTPYCD